MRTLKIVVPGMFTFSDRYIAAAAAERHADLVDQRVILRAELLEHEEALASILQEQEAAQNEQTQVAADLMRVTSESAAKDGTMSQLQAQLAAVQAQVAAAQPQQAPVLQNQVQNLQALLQQTQAQRQQAM